jgi:hypothetical protein
VIFFQSFEGHGSKRPSEKLGRTTFKAKDKRAQSRIDHPYCYVVVTGRKWGIRMLKAIVNANVIQQDKVKIMNECP